METKSEEELLKQQVEVLQRELGNLRLQVTSQSPVQSKDLSLINLIPKWSGTDKAVNVRDFFDSVESSAKVGNWTDIDKIRITVLKLTEVAKAFYWSSVELQSAEITWQAFKAKFLHRFRDFRPPHFHYLQLQSARQGKDETPQEFADRVRALALRTVQKVDDPVLQVFHYEQAERMILSTFIAGLLGNPGQQVCFRMPTTVEEAVQIAVTVFKAEKQERRNQTFFSSVNESESCTILPSVSNQDVVRDRQSRQISEVRPRFSRQPVSKVHQDNARRAACPRPSPGNSVQCYNCGKFGHYARQCFRYRQHRDMNDRGRSNLQSRSRSTERSEVVVRNTHQGNGY